MKLQFAIFTIVLSVFAQQTATKPVLTANPPGAARTGPDAVNTSGTVVQTNAHVITDQQPESGPPSVPNSAAVANSTVANTYIIGPEDTLQISVWKEPGLSGALPVRPDGMISLSLIGDLPAAGLTPAKLSAAITLQLRKFVKEPNVTVVVTSFHPKQIYLLGEVQHVGALVITSDMTPLQAIAAAGGLSSFANSKHIYILRQVQGKQNKIPFDYKKALKDGNQQGISLTPGDTIVVP